MAKKVQVKFTDNIKNYNMFFFIFLSLSVSLPIFYRGTYFEKELLPALIGIYSLFIIWAGLKIKLKEKILTGPTDFILLGIVLIFLLSLFYGVNKRGSLMELSKYMAYLIVFLLAKDLSRDRHTKGLLNLLIVTGVLVAMVGIGTAAGSLEYPDAVLGGRISSTFQYPNTLAAYMSALYFLALSFTINEEKKFIKGLYGMGSGIFIFTLILTYSRAMWLLFPFVVLLYFLILPNNRKLESIIYMIMSALLALPGSFLFTRYMAEGGNKLWLIFFAVALGTGLLTFLVSLLDGAYRKVPIIAIFLAIGIMAVAASGGLIYVLNQTKDLELMNAGEEAKWSSFSRNISNTEADTSYILSISYQGEKEEETPFAARVIVYNIDSKGDRKQIHLSNMTGEEDHLEVEFTTEEDSIGTSLTFQNYYEKTSITVSEVKILDENKDLVKNIPLSYKYIPESIVSRFGSISSGENSFTSRMLFNKDGLKIVKKYPILGAGGDGWVTLYQQYQSSPYWTTQAHNFFIQLWIEIGSLGFLLFLGLIGLLVFFAFKDYRKSEDTGKKVLLVGFLASLAAILGHAFADFDMSLVGYALVFWTILGIMAGNVDEDPMDKYFGRFYKLNFISYLVLALALGLSINTLMIMSSKKHGSNVAASDLEATISSLEKANKLDIFEASYKHDLAKAYLAYEDQTGDGKYAGKAVELKDKYTKLTKFDGPSQAMASSLNMSMGEIDRGLELLERAVTLQPLRHSSYIYKLDGYMAVFQYYFNRGDYEKSEEILTSALTVKEEIRKNNERAYKPMSGNNELVNKIGQVEGIYRNLYDLEDLAYLGYNIDFAYYFDLDINHDGNLDMLATYKPEGSEVDHEVIKEDQSFIRMTNPGEVYGFKYVTPINLEPDTEYMVEIIARGSTNKETFNVYTWSNGSEKANQGGLEAIELTPNWERYSYEFTTDSDIETGRQYIRMQHNGKDKGYIDIKDLVIYKR